MLGLIKKDLLMVKSNLKVIAIILIVFGVMAIQGQGDLSFIPALTSVMIFMSTFSYDEYNKLMLLLFLSQMAERMSWERNILLV